MNAPNFICGFPNVIGNLRYYDLERIAKFLKRHFKLDSGLSTSNSSSLKRTNN